MFTDSLTSPPARHRRSGGRFRVWIMAVCLSLLAVSFSVRAVEATKKTVLKTSELYQATNVWTVHFTFTSEEWKAMEPTQTGGGWMQGGPGGMRLLGPEGGRNGLAAARGLEFEYVHADVEFGSHRFTNVAVRYKGNGTYMRSQNMMKRPLKADLNHFVKGQKLAGITKLNLHNNVADPSWMNESLSYRFYREAGVPAPRNAYAKVYLTVPGLHDHTYLGLYSLMEDVDSVFAQSSPR